MFIEKLKQITNEFLSEARNSPRLLKDMAAMETYLAESYGDRILIELLQNADDAKSSKVILSIQGSSVIFANNGRPFNETDLVAICRSGSSQKTRGNDIGYRGVGFKSSASLSRHILISSNNAVFSFSKKACAAALGVKESDVPTIRVPFHVNPSEMSADLQRTLDSLHLQGYNTIFVFLNATHSIINEEIKQFDRSCLLFLKNISKLVFEHGSSETYTVNRSVDTFGHIVEIDSTARKDKWLLIKDNESELAFKLDNNRIIECDPQEAVFHCYLPTLDQTPIRAKINSQFSTDPSRKHLSLDDNTKNRLVEISQTLQHLVQKCIDGTIPYLGILRLLSERVAYSSIATLLYDSFSEKLLQDTQITLKNGKQIGIAQYQLHAEFISAQEKMYISTTSEYFNSKSAQNNNLHVQEFFEHFCKVKFSAYDYYMLLCDKDFADKCDSAIFAKIYAFVIKNTRTQALVYGKDINYSKCFIKTPAEAMIASAVKQRDKLDTTFVEVLSNYLTKEDWHWFSEHSGITHNIFKVVRNDSLKEVESSIIHVSKWRSAEQSCVDIENKMGNRAQYVGNQNLGYDIVSTTPEGKKRYIEVKLLSSNQGGFTMTNNEYSSAHQLGDSYYIYAVRQKEDGIDVVCIQNPLQSIVLEKRVRQWEWYCESFSGENFSFLYKE